MPAFRIACHNDAHECHKVSLHVAIEAQVDVKCA